jgi:hypothetical protein
MSRDHEIVAVEDVMFEAAGCEVRVGTAATIIVVVSLLLAKFDSEKRRASFTQAVARWLPLASETVALPVGPLLAVSVTEAPGDNEEA